MEYFLCLNDLVCKGVVNTINMIRMLLRFCVGQVAISADIKQFYNSGKLLPSQFNLQRFLYKDEQDPENVTKEGVITTLIYGVKSASCQTECAKAKLAESIKETKPDVALLLESSTYVDDISESKAEKEACLALIEDTNEALADIGCEVKGWVIKGEHPSENVSKDSVYIEIGGMRWFPKLVLLECKIPQC